MSEKEWQESKKKLVKWHQLIREQTKGFGILYILNLNYHLFEKTCQMAACNLSADISQDLCSCNDFPNLGNEGTK